MGLSERCALTGGRAAVVDLCDRFDASAHVGLIELVVRAHAPSIAVNGGTQSRGVRHLPQFRKAEAVAPVVAQLADTLLATTFGVGETGTGVASCSTGIAN